MTIEKATKWAKDRLKNLDRSLFEAQLLLAYHLNKDRVYLITHSDNEVKEFDKFKDLIDRRCLNEPYEYIVGKVSFYDIHLAIKKGVLIPRPETEILIDLVLDIIKKENFKNIVEIGVGSGAISIILANKLDYINIQATDICDNALSLASENIKTFDLSNRVELIKSNLMDNISMKDIDLVVSNPPYIADDFVLEKNVVEYEPSQALFGGKIGDELLKKIILDVKKRGIRYLVCEMGYDQKEAISNFIFNMNINIKRVEFYKDLSQIDRGFIIEFDTNE